MAAACSNSQDANVTNTVEVVPVENAVVVETLTTTNIDASAERNAFHEAITEGLDLNTSGPT